MQGLCQGRVQAGQTGGGQISAMYCNVGPCLSDFLRKKERNLKSEDYHSHFLYDFQHFGLVSFFGLVRIRPLRSVLTISEPWDEGDGFE